ncbi:GntR family transcriptional regulator [Paenibacillus terrae]|uniref:GntR family transcriptional regulator n=1 Tax=Paenibacillus terrae (strain HPL-003) TaxID=985665 RepID=G7VW51_PAETH|nr:GntR family transcriptional regulator [Paenibacillus terrae]AET58852.1 GntR family transcriptional regulator [Paenibacillus terrae HPL-003]
MDESMYRHSGSAGNSVYALLKEQIISLELPPGTALSEKETSVRFQVSRTPVRESFVRLAQEGLVLVFPQRGTKVSLIDTMLVEEARFMREQLECAVIRLACTDFSAGWLAKLEANLVQQRESIERHEGRRLFDLDEAFHRILFEGCGKLATWGVMQQLNVHFNRVRMLRLDTNPHWNHLYDQHSRMVEVIRDKATGEAERIMHEHLNLGVADLNVLREQYPEYFK